MSRDGVMPSAEVEVPAVQRRRWYFEVLQHQVRALQRLLGKKTLEHEILRLWALLRRLRRDPAPRAGECTRAASDSKRSSSGNHNCREG